MDNLILEHNDQYFVGTRKYVHSISLITATSGNEVTVEINRMIRSNYVLVDYATEYGSIKNNQTQVWIKPISGRPPTKTFDKLSGYDRWLFEILENFRYMHQRIENCRIFTTHATASKTVFAQGIPAHKLEYRLCQDSAYWYFAAYHGDKCAYSSTNLKK